jgi:hypothetical protein
MGDGCVGHDGRWAIGGGPARMLARRVVGTAGGWAVGDGCVGHDGRWAVGGGPASMLARRVVGTAGGGRVGRWGVRALSEVPHGRAALKSGNHVKRQLRRGPRNRQAPSPCAASPPCRTPQDADRPTPPPPARHPRTCHARGRDHPREPFTHSPTRSRHPPAPPPAVPTTRRAHHPAQRSKPPHHPPCPPVPFILPASRWRHREELL